MRPSNIAIAVKGALHTTLLQNALSDHRSRRVNATLVDFAIGYSSPCRFASRAALSLYRLHSFRTDLTAEDISSANSPRSSSLPLAMTVAHAFKYASAFLA